MDSTKDNHLIIWSKITSTGASLLLRACTKLGATIASSADEIVRSGRSRRFARQQGLDGLLRDSLDAGAAG